ncbi:Senecionine N-oxygenase [Pseudolycoriella hygida]|uniref:Flavin-containing monooxygenase n=1 Tax=Pseudolycoriella hygida TaxID=35572 RepID=A0A9Q0S6B3_9DIPT|nr:Senecionine N-oxygenase [Pseudolycoriella hygida]
MKVAVVGAGLAGICATKQCLDYGLDVTTFEKTNTIGGTWVYTDYVGEDDFGLDVHTSMYQNLRTNFPKEIMCFPDYDFTGPQQSYVSANEVLQFIKKYAQEFQVEKRIQFRREIVRIRPKATSKWEIMVRNLMNETIEIQIFDAVMVCNGHYSVPRTPEFRGLDLYKGKTLHSHSFRSADVFKVDTIKRRWNIQGETVLVIGGASSGTDVAYFVSKVAQKATISTHDSKRSFPSEIHKKPDVKEFTENGVIFEDGSREDFSVVIFATGYLYSFPFLSMDCGITVDDNFIQPLFKHTINIKFPTMCLIGMPYLVHPPLICYLQIQLFLKFFTGAKTLPSTEEMMRITNEEMEIRWKNGLARKHAHMMGVDLLGDYYADVCNLAGLPPVKPFMMEIYRQNQRNLTRDSVKFREIFGIFFVNMSH